MNFKNMFKNPFNNPKFKYGSYAVLLTLGVVVGIILVNMIVTSLASKVPLKLDLTKNKIFEFSPQTEQVVKGLKNDINVYALYSSSWDNDASVKQIKEYLDRYQKLNSKFKVEYIDPIKNPTFAQKYQQTGENVGGGSIILESGKKYKVINFSDMMGSSQEEGSQSIKVEQMLTGGLVYISQDIALQKAYIVTGYGRDTTASLKDSLTKENYTVGSLNLIANEIPADATVLVISTPEKDLGDVEINKLDKYFDKGGKGVFLFTAGVAQLPKLEQYLAEWGIGVNDDLVVESDQSRYMNPSPIIILPDMQSHDITKNLLNQGLAFIAPQSKSLTLKTDNAQRATVTSLLKSSSKSYAKKDYRQGVEKNADDKVGSFDLGALAVKDKGSSASSPKIMVLGAAFAFDAEMLNYSGAANMDFLLNSFSWITDKKDNLNIRPKVISSEKLSMNGNTFLFIVISLIIVLLLIAAAGFTVWFRRRYK